MMVHSKDLHKKINIVTLDDVEKIVLKEADSCKNLEIYSVMEIDEGNKKGLAFDLFDYLNKETGFEQEVETLLYILDKKLDERFVFSHNYSDESSLCDLDGEEYPDYHCVLKIWELI